MGKRLLGLLVAAGAVMASAATAKMYVDYTPEKGLWDINAVMVDPNHLDDYLVGLKRTQLPGFQILKRRGIIDDYKFLVRYGYTKDSPNVLIETHYTSPAMMAPDKARDQAIEKEILATLSDEEGKTAVAGYEKYRQFLDDGMWGEVTYNK